MIDIISAEKANEISTASNKEISDMLTIINLQIKKAAKDGFYFTDVDSNLENSEIVIPILKKLGYKAFYDDTKTGYSWIHIEWFLE